MRIHFHALFSIFLIFIAIVIALAYLSGISPVLGLAYAAVTVVSLLILFYSYCSKCACRRKGCLHIVPGLATRILPQRKDAPYRTTDYVGLIVSFLIIILFPQPWMWRNMTVLTVFWIITLLSVMEIYLFVCRDCGNANCPRYMYLSGRNRQ